MFFAKLGGCLEALQSQAHQKSENAMGGWKKEGVGFCDSFSGGFVLWYIFLPPYVFAHRPLIGPSWGGTMVGCPPLPELIR